MRCIEVQLIPPTACRHFSFYRLAAPASPMPSHAVLAVHSGWQMPYSFIDLHRRCTPEAMSRPLEGHGCCLLLCQVSIHAIHF